MKSNKMYQVSTIQALSLGYTRPVVTVAKLLSKGDTGLGAFESVNGEMIVLDGNCYQANDEGDVYQATPEMGIPFASVSTLDDCKSFSIDHPTELNSLRELLTQKIEEDFGLNSMHKNIFSQIFRKTCQARITKKSEHKLGNKVLISHEPIVDIFPIDAPFNQLFFKSSIHSYTSHK